MKWEDVLVMPQGELVEHIEQLQHWAQIMAGGETPE